MNKVIRVSAAIVIDDGDILIARRRKDKKNPLLWEFAGGKIEPGETAEESLVREFREELDMEISVGEFFRNTEFSYDFGIVSLEVYFAKTLTGRNIVLNAHKEIAWVKPEQLSEYDFTPPDKVIVDELLRRHRNNFPFPA